MQLLQDITSGHINPQLFTNLGFFNLRYLFFPQSFLACVFLDTGLTEEDVFYLHRTQTAESFECVVLVMLCFVILGFDLLLVLAVVAPGKRGRTDHRRQLSSASVLVSLLY